MSAFLTQLAGIALGHGTPGAAEVVLPPRFAPPPSAQGAQVNWPPENDPAAAADEEPSPPLHSLQSDWRESGQDDDAAPIGARQTKAAPAVTAAATKPPLPHPSTRSDLPRSQRRVAAAPARKPTQQSLTRPSRDAAAPPMAVVSPAAPLVAPMSRRDIPPLSDAVLASRVSRPEAAPVVHVTIDRIDVRAPDVSKPAAAAKPPRRQPAISLADYLRGSRRGSRP
jgi:hypothetical protein